MKDDGKAGLDHPSGASVTLLCDHPGLPPWAIFVCSPGEHLLEAA